MIYKNMELYNVSDIIENSEGKLSLSRYPDIVRKEMWNTQISFVCDNAEIRFKMIDDEVKLVIEYYEDRQTIVLIHHGCFKENGNTIIKKGRNEITIKKPANLDRLKKMEDEANMPYDSEMVRIILLGGQFAPPEIEGNIELPTSLKRPQKTYLAYGSSITSGGCAGMADMTYPSLTAWKLKAECINLGCSGSAFLEAAVADYIAELKGIDYISLELGVNMVWDSSIDNWRPPELFRERVEYFVPRIARSHKGIPIVCTDIFSGGNDIFRDKEVFEYRDIVRETALKIERQSNNFKYVSGTDLLTTFEGLSFDQIHPTSRGMINISDNLFNYFKKCGGPAID